MKHWLALGAIAALSGCADGAGQGPLDASDGANNTDASAMDGSAQVGTLSLVEVPWNSAHLDLGHIQAVTEATLPDMGSFLILFGDAGAQVVRGGAVLAGDPTVTAWKSASVIPAADATGQWPVGIDAMGRVQRLRGLSTLEDVTERYGLTAMHVTGAGEVSPGLTAFAYTGGIALADGTTVTRYSDSAFDSGFATGSGRVAGIANGMARMYDTYTPGMPLIYAYPVPDAAYVAVDSNGHVVVATPHAIWAQDELLVLQEVFHSDAVIHGLARSGSRLWFGAGTELGTLEGGRVSVTHGLGIPADATLSSSPTGDVWLLSAGTLRRFGIPGDPDETDWQTNVLPIYSRVCHDCHAPGNQVSHVDLSTYDAWRVRRDDIHYRVIDLAGSTDSHRMPPANGTPLLPDEVTAIRVWTAAGGADGGLGGGGG